MVRIVSQQKVVAKKVHDEIEDDETPRYLSKAIPDKIMVRENAVNLVDSADSNTVEKLGLKNVGQSSSLYGVLAASAFIVNSNAMYRITNLLTLGSTLSKSVNGSGRHRTLFGKILHALVTPAVGLAAYSALYTNGFTDIVNEKIQEGVDSLPENVNVPSFGDASASTSGTGGGRTSSGN